MPCRSAGRTSTQRLSAYGGVCASPGLFDRMTRRVPFVMLLVAAALLAIGVVSTLRFMFPPHRRNGLPDQQTPVAVELIEPGRASHSRPTRGMLIGHEGFGTILSAPERRLLRSARRQPAVASNAAVLPPVAARLAGLVRLVARVAPGSSYDRQALRILEISRRFGTIILRDGCLRLAESGEPHVILPEGSKLYVDTNGFLTVGATANDMDTDARLGEPAWWEEQTRSRVGPGAIASIRARCGPGGAILIGSAQSVSATRDAGDEAAARIVVDRYGLDPATALAKVRHCRARLARSSGIDPRTMIDNPCGSTPPSPVGDPSKCPAGTSLRGGLCRTSAGHIRPIPVL